MTDMPPSRNTLKAARVLKPLHRAVLIVSLVAVLPLQGLTPAAQARGFWGRLSRVVPFAGVLVGLNHRNRVYRSAERFIDERNAYYDGLRETARKQLVNREIGGLRPSQAAAYVKVVGLIEQHRTLELQVAEDRKRGARQAFHDRLEEAALYALAGSHLARDLIGALQKGVGNAQQALDRVLNTLTSGGTSGLQDLQRIRDIAEKVSFAAGAIGGKPGQDLQRASERIMQAIDRPQAEVQAAIQDLQSELGNVNQTLDTLNQIGRGPSAGGVIEHVVASHLPGGGGSSDVGTEAVAEVLSRLEVGDGSLKDEALAAIREGFVARCAAFADAYQANLAALRNGGGSAPSGGTAVTTCQAVKPGDLTRRAEADFNDMLGITPTEVPTEVMLPKFSAQGEFPEAYSGSAYPDPPMGTAFTLTADLAAGTITGTLTGGRTIKNVPIECGVPGDPPVVSDYAYAAFTASYQASFSAALDPESGDFSAAITPAGSCSARWTQPFTVEGCTALNSQPVPGCNPWTGQGTISGYVSKDGYIELTTKWTTGGGASATGTWSGGGTVSTP